MTENEKSVTRQSVTLSRAHALYEGLSRLSRVTEMPRDSDKRCDSDSDSFTPEGVAVTITVTPAPLEFGPLSLDATPGSIARWEEKRELMRIAAVSALKRSNNGRDLIPDARAWALKWASVPPLGRPLSSGEPTAEVA